MKIIRLLYIDDSRINSQIEKLGKKLHKNGIELRDEFLYLGLEKFKKRDENDKVILDFDKIKKHIEDNYFNERFDIIISDYDFNDSNLDGYILLKWIKNVGKSHKTRYRKAKYCLYSAQTDKLVAKLDTPDKVKKLIKLKLDDFITRDNLVNDLYDIINKNDEEFLYSEKLLDFLHKYPNLEFNSIYPKFKGKKLSELIIEIEKDLPNGIEFQKDLVELTVAHFIELNKYKVDEED